MKRFVFILVFYISFFINAQYQFGNWVLSENAGVSFINEMPAFFDSSLNFEETTSTATISDMEGNLLFYTNGSTVFNMQNQVMENGHGLDSNGGWRNIVILPFEEENIYYIYHLNHNLTNNKEDLLYTKVDMSQNNGLGKVMEKNVLVAQDLGQFLTAVKIPCENAYWLATYYRSNGNEISTEIYMHKIELEGQTEIVENNLPLIHSWVMDQMTFSPDGKKFMFGDPVVGTNIRSFDIETGILGEVLFQLPNNIVGFFGEFSPNSKMFYTYDMVSLNLIQVDLEHSSLQYINLEDFGFNLNEHVIDDLKLSIDGKIYITTSASFPSPFLHRIENPNEPLENLEITVNAIDFSPKILTGFLPVIIPNMNVIPKINVAASETECNTFLFDLQYNQDTHHITWDFGDDEVSNELNPNHTYTQSGNYLVTVEFENQCGEIVNLTTELNVEIPDFENIETEFSICNGETITLQAPQGFSYYQWSNGESGENLNFIEVSESGNYSVTITENTLCSYQIDFNVYSGNEPIISFIETTSNSIIVHAEGDGNFQYSINGFVWQISNEFNYLQPGVYTVYVRDGSCITSQQVAIFFIPTLFTPNDDGVNDTWNIKGLEIYPYSKVEIYDRYGKMIYSNRINGFEVWDGKDNKNQKVATQDYWYIIYVSNGDKMTGHVTVKNRY